MSALNACMTVGYVAGAAKRGITLTRLEIETTGELDLRGFLDLSDAVPPGYPVIDYVVRIAGDGTPEQFEEIHAEVQATSPNYDNIARAIRMKAGWKWPESGAGRAAYGKSPPNQRAARPQPGPASNAPEAGP